MKQPFHSLLRNNNCARTSQVPVIMLLVTLLNILRIKIIDVSFEGKKWGGGGEGKAAV